MRRLVPREREGGFDRVAARIGRFREVRSLFLMSGAYDLMVIVGGDNLREVASALERGLYIFEADRRAHPFIPNALTCDHVFTSPAEVSGVGDEGVGNMMT